VREITKLIISSHRYLSLVKMFEHIHTLGTIFINALPGNKSQIDLLHPLTLPLQLPRTLHLKSHTSNHTSSNTPKPTPLAQTNFLHAINLPTPHRRPRTHIIPRIRRILSQIHQDPRITTLIRAGQRRQRTRTPAPAARDLDLRATEIKLRFVGLHGHVQRDMLDAQEVVAVRGGLGDGCVGRFVFVCVRG
jgi:hypothetical protein